MISIKIEGAPKDIIDVVKFVVSSTNCDVVSEDCENVHDICKHLKDKHISVLDEIETPGNQFYITKWPHGKFVIESYYMGKIHHCTDDAFRIRKFNSFIAAYKVLKNEFGAKDTEIGEKIS